MNDIKARARALVPEIVARRDEIERARRIPADLNAKLVQAGLLRMLVPAEIGGLEMVPLDYVEVIELLGEADASTGWCTMIAAVTCLKSAFLDREVARALYGDPAAVHGGVFAPNGRADVDGDLYVVNGDWQWASGSANCTWLTGGALVYEGGQLRKLPNGAPDARQFLFPADAVEFADDWNVSGLCGTGSGSMKVRNCRVPRTHAVSLVTDRQQFGGPLYVFPSFGMLALGISVVAMGNASGAVNDLIALAAEKTPQGTRRVLAQRAHTQIEVARAVAMLLGARLPARRHRHRLGRGARRRRDQRARPRGASARLHPRGAHQRRGVQDDVRAGWRQQPVPRLAAAAPPARRVCRQPAHDGGAAHAGADGEGVAGGGDGFDVSLSRGGRDPDSVPAMQERYRAQRPRSVAGAPGAQKTLRGVVQQRAVLGEQHGPQVPGGGHDHPIGRIPVQCAWQAGALNRDDGRERLDRDARQGKRLVEPVLNVAIER
ncbi:MAG: acyl-CoA dehydrogenase family protein [Burkholderiaceae bacterium]